MNDTLSQILIYLPVSIIFIVVFICLCRLYSDKRTDAEIEEQFKDIENSNSEFAVTNRQLINRLSDAQATTVRIDNRIERSSEGIGRAAETADSLESRIRDLERTSRTSEELIAECEKIIEEAEKKE